MTMLQKGKAANGDKLIPLQHHLFHWNILLAATQMLELYLETRQKGPSALWKPDSYFMVKILISST